MSRSAPGPISTRLPAAVDAWVRAQPGSPAEVMRQLAIRAMQAANGQLPDATKQPELEADTSPSAASVGGGSVSPGGSPARSADPAPASVPEVATRAELLALAAQMAELAAAVTRLTGGIERPNPPPVGEERVERAEPPAPDSPPVAIRPAQITTTATMPSPAPAPSPVAVEAHPTPSLSEPPRVVRDDPAGAEMLGRWPETVARMSKVMMLNAETKRAAQPPPINFPKRPISVTVAELKAPAPVAVQPSHDPSQFASRPVLPPGFSLTGVALVSAGQDITGYRLGDLERRLPTETFAAFREWLEGQTVGVDDAGGQVVYLQDWEQWLRGGFPLD